MQIKIKFKLKTKKNIVKKANAVTIKNQKKLNKKIKSNFWFKQ